MSGGWGAVGGCERDREKEQEREWVELSSHRSVLWNEHLLPRHVLSFWCIHALITQSFWLYTLASDINNSNLECKYGRALLFIYLFIARHYAIKEIRNQRSIMHHKHRTFIQKPLRWVWKQIWGTHSNNLVPVFPKMKRSKDTTSSIGKERICSLRC